MVPLRTKKKEHHLQIKVIFNQCPHLQILVQMLTMLQLLLQSLRKEEEVEAEAF